MFRQGTSLVRLPVAVLLLTTFVSGHQFARADEPVASPPVISKADDVALVDLNRVLKNHGKFNLTMNALKVAVQESEQRFGALRNEILEMDKQLAALKPGTDEHQQLAEKILLKKNEFTGQAQVEKQRFINEEGAAYATAYRDVTEHIQKYADEHGIRLVLRANSDAPKLNTPQDVVQAYNNPVLYQKGLDITEEIIKRVNGMKVSQKSDSSPRNPPAKR